MFIDLVRESAGEEKDAGTQYHYNCPFCGDEKYRLYISKDTGMWFCQNEQKGGNPFQFVMELYGISFPEAKEILEGYGYEQNDWRKDTEESGLTSGELLQLHIKSIGEKKQQGNEEQELDFPPLPTNTKLLKKNFDNPEAFPFFEYLHQRKVSLEQIKKHQIMYCTYGEAERADGKTIKVYNHLIFPTMYKGKPHFWNTRSIQPNPFIKSYNAPEKEGQVSAGKAVFNLDRAKKTGRIIITEGVFDALTVGDSGVATFGKGITSKQSEMLVEAAKETNASVYLYLDSDAWRHLVTYAERIRGKNPDIPLYYVLPKTNQDANDIGHKEAMKLVDQAIKADRSGDIYLNLAMSR